MLFSNPINKLIRQRYSCRAYLKEPISEKTQNALNGLIENLPDGPFPRRQRFMLAAATDSERRDLRGLGTYGFIKNAPGFLIGSSAESPYHLENFGYLMEYLVLAATDLGLGSCWLGGSFTRSGFANRIHAAPDEIIPAVCSVGRAVPNSRDNTVRRTVRADERLVWSRLFFEGSFDKPLTPESAENWKETLEMVRLGPSASNKQPWRIVKQDRRWHFYVQRTEGYREGFLTRLLGVADMQRVDMGIAMCHFELSAREAGLSLRWEVTDPNLPLPDTHTEYIVSAIEP